MAEQLFRSPGFFEREIDVSARETEIVGVPAGVIGTAQMGPAFVPVTVGSFSDFESRFGTLDPSKFGPYAVREFLKHRTALTYIRVLGAGANESTTDISNTQTAGIVKGAGFRLTGSIRRDHVSSTMGRWSGCVQFLAARHYVSASNEEAGYPIFSDNQSYDVPSADADVYLVRGMLFVPTGTRFEIMSWASASYNTDNPNGDFVPINSDGCFKLIVSSSAGAGFYTEDGAAGIRVYTASLNPASDAYIANILNTDPERFQVEQHLLYADFPVQNEIAAVADPGAGDAASTSRVSVALLSGSASASMSAGLGGLEYLQMYGRFDTRYTTPRTTQFISQPYGRKEFELFNFETISDGAYANDKFKISISNVRKSSDPQSPYGSFTVEVRAFGDTDTSAQILEQYSNCTLNPNDDDFVAKKIGDFRPRYNFDAERDDEKKVNVTGQYPNKSTRVRIIMSNDFANGAVPASALPFGFRGLPVLKTSDTLRDISTSSLGTVGNSSARRLTGVGVTSVSSTSTGRFGNYATKLTGSIVPPVPFRFKVTKNKVAASPTYIGEPGTEELVDSRLYWGCKFTNAPKATTDDSSTLLKANASSEINNLFRSYSKFLGIEKLDALVTGSGADKFNNNKFTLARVALNNRLVSDSLPATANSVLTASAKEHILETAYIRNGKPDASNYTVKDGSRARRLTFASLAALTSSVYFNRFSGYAKFTNFFYGGFDGLNILDKDMARMNDKASSSDTGGLAGGGSLDIGLSSENIWGSGKTNAVVASYRAASRIISDPMASRVNIIVIPGIRDKSVADYLQSRLSSYSKAFYVMDLPSYNADGVRIFGDTTWTTANVDKTAEQFAGRAVNNNYSATYFPDVSIEDPINNRPVAVPASVAVMGALSYNDSVAYPWFAPAGFNRAALDFVTNVKVRLNNADRDTLYDSRINPIATFPTAGYVIFGQKTLQFAKSALDRVNVRRMLLEVKRQVVAVANKIVFEPNTAETRARFVSQVTPLLATIQSQQGIDQFKVVMDDSNNTQTDVENNILNGRIVVVPTRAVEFIAIDFIITHAGVSFD